MEKNTKILIGGVVIVLIAIAGYFTFFGAQEKIYTEGTQGAINVKKGDTFKITLKSNPTTGYQWNADFDETLIQLVDTSYKADEPQLMGSGGTEIFEFKAIGSNSNTTIKFAYARAWESVPPIDEKSFNIKIK
ncbi:MAG: Chagasin family peptidase inhibitor I42 [Candidatus Methanofastidiosum methylothiophilum]|uniref:Chagasin family peptidase inhibitor I42 n=1 Tax=Candidatus Methanofastidiosum methylothiophilum TaxID=1705564 RepID=A0A150JAF5_9EURY|nr:MAG: Chagasin family peptidase inhibitor I42 [Candidatus Methanofastidiosum methylthiophilus]NMC76706.1 protease inhibitor I42 family protein [Candidatus Methanofastidiosa archaeon]